MAQWVLDAGQDGQTKLLGQDVLVQLSDGVTFGHFNLEHILASVMRVGDDFQLYLPF